MKKIFLASVFVFVLVFFATTASADDKTAGISKTTIQSIVDKVLELNGKNTPKEQIVSTVFDMYGDKSSKMDDKDDDDDDDNGDDSKSSKSNSEFKKLNFGQVNKKFKRGDSGEEVKALQEALNKIALDLGLEFDVLVADGKYGSNTVKVVKMIQAMQELKEDGVIGPVTLAKLQDLLKKNDLNTATKNALSMLRPITEIIYDTKGNYGTPESNIDVCSVSLGVVSGEGMFKDDILKHIQQTVTASDGKDPVCLSSDGDLSTTNGNVSSWAVSIPVDTGKSLCVDSNGFLSYGNAVFSSVSGNVSCVE